MAKVIGRKELCETELNYFVAIQGIDNRRLFDRYKSLENIINHHIDPKYKHFISFPVENDETNKITFYGKTYKETPQLFSELEGEESKKYDSIKKITLAHYNETIKSLRANGKETEAKFLEGATKFVDEQFLYCYDGIVVLGIWGMKLRENIREPINQIRKSLFKSVPKYTITFDAGSDGKISGDSELRKPKNSFIEEGEMPEVNAHEGFKFIGWDEDPKTYQITEDKIFTARYESTPAPAPTPVIDSNDIEDDNPDPEPPPPSEPAPKLPWYKRFWIWLTDKGCLKWLLWLLLILLLILLFSWLFRSCNEKTAVIGGEGLNDRDSTWIADDPYVRDDGGIYDPYNPYDPRPTPPAYEGILPPQEGVLPPIDDDVEIIPGNPSIIANRLNVLMENEDKSILDLARDFKVKYPGEEYQVMYYDDMVKRMQIMVPPNERERLKESIPPQFAPEYELFVFDESLFEGNYSPNDPDFSNQDKSWYLKAVRAPEAWDISRGSDKISIAIIDNGFNLSHPELKSKVISPYNVWTHSAEIFPQQIDHGTHVAGIALATGDNGIGMLGIAPECKFLPVQVADRNGMMTITSVLDGILYALYQGANVINVSLGAQFTDLSRYSQAEQQNLIRNHFKEEERLWRRVMRIAANHNSTLVVAAGNDNALAGIEALHRPDLFIVVSAVDKNLQSPDRAPFSNFGRYSTVSAPGVDIYSTVGRNDYKVMEGTSMAAPIVSGAVALLKSLDESLTSKQIGCILQSTGIDVRGDIGNLIQLDKALQMVQSQNIADCPPPVPSTGDVQILLNWENYNDLDLICTDPFGETIFYRNKHSASGGFLEIDMNVEYPDSKTPVENIYWEPGTAPEGTYNVYLQYYKNHVHQSDTTPYKIKVIYGDNEEEYTGTITKNDGILHICSFTLGTPSSVEADNPQNGRRSQLEQERNRLKLELERVERELQQLTNRR